MPTRLLRGTLLLCLSLLYFSPGLSAATMRLTYTYNEVELGRIFQAFEKQYGLDLEATWVDQDLLKSHTITKIGDGEAPHMLLMPADHLGLYNFTNYSEVDPTLFKAKISDRIWASGISDGKVLGVPIMQGNHLVLYYNRALVPQAARTWQEMQEQWPALKKQGLVAAAAWRYKEPFWFVPFVNAFGAWPLKDNVIKLDTPAMADALDFYADLVSSGVVKADCAYECAAKHFAAGKVAYTIDGEWNGKQFLASLGDNLAVAPIPAVGDKPAIPSFTTHVLAFPEQSFTGEHRNTMIKLVNYLQSAPVQSQLWRNLGAIPVEPVAYQEILDSTSGYLKRIVDLMPHTTALPSGQTMTFIWDAIEKGLLRRLDGDMPGTLTARQMQKLAQRHMKNAEKQLDNDLLH